MANWPLMQEPTVPIGPAAAAGSWSAKSRGAGGVLSCPGNEGELVRQVRSGREDAVERGCADGETGCAGLDRRRDALGTVDGTCHDHRSLAGGGADGAHQSGNITLEA